MNLPLLGFGTYKLPGEQVREPLIHSLEIGYRHIDTADYYQNHEVIGDVWKNSGIPRNQLWITSKLWWENLLAATVLRTAERFIKELSTDYLDLLLIHWPNKSVAMSETLGAMERLKQAGKIRFIGVSNFTERHLAEALETGVELLTNQVECHPTFNQTSLRTFCEAQGVSLTAYMPIGRGVDLSDPTVKELATNYGRPRSQVILNWHRAHGVIAIPKATSRAHIEENWEALEWNLSKEDAERIDQIKQQPRLVNPEFGEFDDDIT